MTDIIPPNPGRDADPLRVLIADDEPLIRKALQRLFERRGHSTQAVPDAPSAVAALSADRFDAVLVDLRMPGNGLTVIHHLERDTSFGGVVVLMTGDLSAEAMEQVGPHVKRLEKPFRFPDVLPLVENGVRD